MHAWGRFFIGLILSLFLVGGVVHPNSVHTTSLAAIETISDAGITPGTFRATGNMRLEVIDGHRATLLQNGQVLVTGGFVIYTRKNAQIYDPDTETWESTGKMYIARMRHSATLLADGRVLVAGGSNAHRATPTDSAEIYDPDTGSWTNVGSMTTGRSSHAATRLLDGRVLVFGGRNADSIELTSAEIFDPLTGVWSPTGSMMNSALPIRRAILLPAPDGRVVAISDSSTEIYDPAVGTWLSKTAMTTYRSYFTTTLLMDGTILVTGGGSSETYNPLTDTWTGTGDVATATGYQHTATLLADGTVLVAAGSDNNLHTEVFNPVTRKWTRTGDMATKLAGHTATLLNNGQVLFAGGEMWSGRVLTTAQLFTPNEGPWFFTGSMLAERMDHAAVLLPDGRVLVSGGNQANGVILNSAEIYNPLTSAWELTGNMTTARTNHTLTLLQSGLVLVTGGFTIIEDSNESTASVEIYNPATGQWSATGNLVTGRHGHTATLLSNGEVLVTGGNQYDTGTLSSAELYNPSSGAWSAISDMQTGRDFHNAVLLPNGKVLVLGSGTSEVYNPDTEAWESPSTMLANPFRPAADLLPNGQVMVAGGRIGYLPTNNVEIYDPTSNSWSAGTALLRSVWNPQSVVLADGKVLLVGGITTGPLEQPERELIWTDFYDPTSGSWTPNGRLGIGRTGHTVTQLLDGRILTAGGFSITSLVSAEIYWPEAQQQITPHRLVLETPAGDSQPMTRTFTISNSGSKALTWSLSEDPQVYWLSVSPANGNLPPGASTQIVLTITTGLMQPGEQLAGSFLLASNDPDQPEVTIPVELEAGWYQTFMPVTNSESYKAIYTFTDRCASRNYYSGSNIVGRVTWCVPKVLIGKDGSMQFFSTWKTEIFDGRYCVYKYDDAGNKNMVLVDNLSNRYDHYNTGGAAAETVCQKNNETVTGWFQFPPAKPGAEVFRFDDMDQYIQISNINLSP
jgi:N-acetylneuraminic acid mutarotase